MTLITHIWTNMINVIAGDGRIMDETLSNPLVTDEMRKIYPNKNSFVAFHGSCVINENSNLPTVIKVFYKNHSPKSCQEIALELVKDLRLQKNELTTGLVIGGQFQAVEAFYVKDASLIDERIQKPIGVRFNFDSEEQKNRIIFLLNNAIQTITNNELFDWPAYDQYSDVQYQQIFDHFYTNVYKDSIANHSQGIGKIFDLGIIRKGNFNWLKTTTKILEVTNKGAQ